MKPPSSNQFENAEPGPRKAHKRHILSCALACFDEFGIEATTIDMIRERADSSVGSIYHHFGNKDGLIAALYLAALDDQFALAQPRMASAATPRESVEALVRTYLEWVTQQPQLARFLFRARQGVAFGPYKEELAKRNKQRYEALLNQLAAGIKEGVILPFPKEIFASLLIGQSENYCRAWLAQRVKAKPTAYVDIFVQAAWTSVSKS
ncbi:MAG TPA: TetR/AcrR family transcriptional regulator [Burkholderiaceae bacterium]|nr:TetR/AcrR family transcriptional regulator [Burkholderiaceae bacterium]